MPWRELLSAGPDAPKLSLARTEDEFLDSASSAGLMIHRTWDIDSFIARVTSFMLPCVPVRVQRFLHSLFPVA
jgi:hypothetical protein